MNCCFSVARDEAVLPGQEGVQPGGDVDRAAAADGAAKHSGSLHEDPHPVAHHLPKDHGIRHQHLAEADRQAGKIREKNRAFLNIILLWSRLANLRALRFSGRL